MQSLSVLIPAYNEEILIQKTALSMLNYLQSLKIDFEIIICVNNSTDKTEDIVRSLAKKNKQIKYLSINKKGFGLALQEGIKIAKKDLITYMPADNEIEHDFIERALSEINNFDVISGSRYLKGASQSTTLLFRKFLSRAYAQIIKLLFSNKITEFGTVKMFRSDWAKKMMNECTSVHWDFQIEMLYFALRDKKRIKEIPLQVRYQSSRESSVNPLNDIISLFKSAIKYSIKLRIHQLFH